jgi:Short C-terminal domain
MIRRSSLTVSSVRSLCIIPAGKSEEDVVLATDEGLIGFRRCKSSIIRVDGQPHQLVEEFARALQELNPSIEVSRPASTSGLGVIRWTEPGAKVGFFKSAMMDARELAESQKARKASEPEVEVKRYKDAKDYEKDARRMLSSGWRMEGQVAGHGRVNMGRTVLKAGVLLPWAVMRPSRKGDPITVTWLKGGQLTEIDEPQGIGGSVIAEREDITETLRKLAELRDDGIITAEEFDMKKADLLSRI